MSEYIMEWVADKTVGRKLASLDVREEIVRCKDCVYLIAHGAGCEYWDYCDVESADGFCAWGERITANGGIYKAVI